MTANCRTAVRMATGDVFSDAEIDDFLNRLESRAKAAGRARPDVTAREAIATAAAALTKEEALAALAEKRLKIAKAAADQVRARQLTGLMRDGLTPAQALDAVNVGTERQAYRGAASIDAEGRARQMTLWGKVDIGLRQRPGLINRLSNPWNIPGRGEGERGFDRLVAREMARLSGAGDIEPTGDADALHAARVFASALEDARQMQNAKGAWISRLQGYIARQSHDPVKLAGGLWSELGALADRAKAGETLDWAAARAQAEGRAFRTWRDFIRPRLAEATFTDAEDLATQIANPVDAEGNPKLGKVVPDPREKRLQAIVGENADVRDRFLAHVWMDVIEGRHVQLAGAQDENDFRTQGMALARAVSRSRVLHFRAPDDWIDYNNQYGRSSLMASIMDQLGRAGRNTALMGRWGPDPDRAFEAEREALGAHAGTEAQAKALANDQRLAKFETVNGRGDAPENLRLARVMQSARAFEAMAKLGSIVLSKATDLPITGQVFARAGMGWLAGYRAFFTGILHLGGEEGKAAADALDVGARAFSAHVGGQFLASDGAKGWTSYGVRLLYKVNLFEAFNEAIRHGAAQVLASSWGSMADRAFGDLHPGTQETFARFGISAADWDAARSSLEAAPDGRRYFTLDKVADPEVALRFRTLIHNLLDDTVSEPRAREKVSMMGRTRPGTVEGEALRAFFQFKGFVSTIVGRHLVPAAKGFAGYSPVATMAHLILGTALAGYVSMNAKRVASGVQPVAPIGDPADMARTWGAAMSQGGGLGLYGDFLFGAFDRSGHDFDFGELGGPMIADAEHVAQIVQQSIAGGEVNETTGKSPVPGELAHLAASNAPLVNLWYTRLAMDYVLWWRLEEAANPGYLQRYESRQQNQAHRDWIVRPTSVLGQ